MPPATDTFSDVTLPIMGMETSKSHFLRTRSCKPFAFGSQHQRAIHVVIEFVVALGGALVESNRPDVALLQVFQRAGDVDHARHRHMLGGSG